MKQLIISLGCLALLPIGQIASAQDTSECHHLSATGNSEYPPFLWRESKENVRLIGANSLIMDELGRRLGIQIDVKHVGPWSRAQLEVKSGHVDLMVGAFYTSERSEYMDYFYPAFLNTTSVVWQSQKRPFDFHEKEDLQNRWGVTVINNSFGQEFDAFAQQNLSISEVGSLSQAFRMLSVGRVEYALYEKEPGLAYASMLGLDKELLVMSPPVSSEGLYLALSKKSACNTPAFKKRIEDTLAEMGREGFNSDALKQGLTNWNKTHQSGTNSGQ